MVREKSRANKVSEQSQNKSKRYSPHGKRTAIMDEEDERSSANMTEE